MKIDNDENKMMMMMKPELVITHPGIGDLHSIADLTLKYHHKLFSTMMLI